MSPVNRSVALFCLLAMASVEAFRGSLDLTASRTRSSSAKSGDRPRRSSASTKLFAVDPDHTILASILGFTTAVGIYAYKDPEVAHLLRVKYDKTMERMPIAAISMDQLLALDAWLTEISNQMESWYLELTNEVQNWYASSLNNKKQSNSGANKSEPAEMPSIPKREETSPEELTSLLAEVTNSVTANFDRINRINKLLEEAQASVYTEPLAYREPVSCQAGTTTTSAVGGGGEQIVQGQKWRLIKKFVTLWKKF